jgi:hypothetical protein
MEAKILFMFCTFAAPVSFRRYGPSGGRSVGGGGEFGGSLLRRLAIENIATTDTSASSAISPMTKIPVLLAGA